MKTQVYEKDEKMQLYDEDRIQKAKNEIMAMAKRFDVSTSDVMAAAWIIARDVVAARLKRDLEDRR